MSNPLADSFIKFIEQGTSEEAKKILEKHQEQMSKELEEAMSKVVAQAGVRLSEIMSIQDLGRTVRIEITKAGDDIQ